MITGNNPFKEDLSFQTVIEQSDRVSFIKNHIQHVSDDAASLLAKIFERPGDRISSSQLSKEIATVNNFKWSTSAGSRIRRSGRRQ